MHNEEARKFGHQKMTWAKSAMDVVESRQDAYWTWAVVDSVACLMVSGTSVLDTFIDHAPTIHTTFWDAYNDVGGDSATDSTRYRVGFSFSLRETPHYFTEWFDTLDGAMEFVNYAGHAGIFPNWVEDENGGVV